MRHFNYVSQVKAALKNTLPGMSGQWSPWQNQITPQFYILFQFMGCFHHAMSVKVHLNSTYLTSIEYKQSLTWKKNVLLKSQVHSRMLSILSLLVDSLQASTASSVYRCNITFPAVKILLRTIENKWMNYYLRRLKTSGRGLITNIFWRCSYVCQLLYLL